jgi:hypothetical protein
MMEAGTKVRPEFDLIGQVAGLTSICLVLAGSTFGEFAIIVNPQLCSLGRKLKRRKFPFGNKKKAHIPLY